MSGFPNRISRSTLGPKLQDKYPVVKPTEEVGAATVNLDFWQLAGMNLTAARALLYVTATVSAGTTVYQGIAWDPDGTLPLVTWTRAGLGTFEFALASSTYKDEANADITVELLGGAVFPQALSGSNLVFGQYQKTGVRSGRVHLYSPQAAAKVDVDFILALF
jgi:hypothetical protein